MSCGGKLNSVGLVWGCWNGEDFGTLVREIGMVGLYGDHLLRFKFRASILDVVWAEEVELEAAVVLEVE